MFLTVFGIALLLLAAPRASAITPNNPGDPLFCQPQEGVVFLIVNGGSGVFTADADCYNNNVSNDTTLSITTTQGGSLAGTRSGGSVNYIYTPPTPTFTGLDTFQIPVTTVWNGNGGTGSAGGTSRPGGPTTFTITLNVLAATTTLTAYSGQAVTLTVPAGSISNCVSTGNASLGPKPTDILGCVKGIEFAVAPHHGSLVASGNTLKYTPTSGYSGSDTFAYQAYGINSDGTGALNSGNITVQVTVLPSSTTTLTVNNASSNAGDTITGSVTVTPSSATGTVSLLLDGSTATTCTLSSGSCTWSLEDVAAGTHSLVASYPGETNAVGSSNSATKTLTVTAAAVSGDSRTVIEPSIPAVCQQLVAALTTNATTQDLDTSMDATDSNPDGVRIQAALDGCAAGSGSVAVELSMDSSGAYNAFLSGPLHIPSNVTLLVDPAVTLYFSRNVQDYDYVSGIHTCGTINNALASASCLPMIDIPSTSTNVGIMGFGKINGRGGDALLNGFATSSYPAPVSYTWWNLAQQANGDGNPQNPNLVQIENGASTITLYKISLLNSPMAHIATTGPATNLTVWDAKLITPGTTLDTDGIDAANVQNATVTKSWISTGGDNVAISAPGASVEANNISITQNNFFAGSGANIGSNTLAGVSNVLFDKNMSAGNGFAGYGSAALNSVTSANSTAIRIKSANDRGGTVTGIQYSNSCFLDHVTDIQVTPYFGKEDSVSAFPLFTDILLKNLEFADDASSAGTVELTGEYNSNGGNSVTLPLRATVDNVTFPAGLSSLVSSATPVYGTTVWGAGNQSGGPGQNTVLTVGPGAVSSNFITAYTATTVSAGNNNSLTNTSSGSLNPPTCNYTYLAPELTGPNGVNQDIVYGVTPNLDVVLTPAVAGAPNPSGTATLTDALTNNTFSGVFNGTGDTVIVAIPLSDLGLGTHTFSVTSYTGDSKYSVAPFGSTTITVSQATPQVTEWPTASNINPGQTLASSELTGGSASVPGTFAFTTPTTAPSTGTAAQSVTFTPTDAVDYASVVGTVNVMVGRLTPNVTTWPSASSISYGQTLASSNLSGGAASVAGTFAFTTPTTAPTAGTAAQSVTFTPADTTDYNSVTGTANVNVTKVSPNVTTWPTASLITYGQTLASSNLSGGAASVAGTFAFTTPTTAPTAGTAAQSVTFTPTDSTDDNSVTGTVSVTVAKAVSAVSLTSSANPSMIQAAVTLTATVISTAGTPTGTVNFMDGTTLLGSGTLSAGVTTLTTSTLGTGSHSITAVYSADSSFAAQTSAAFGQSVIDFTVTSSGGSGGGTGSSSGSTPTQTVLPGGAVSYPLAIVPSSGTTMPSAITLTVTGLPSGATVSIETTTWTQQSSNVWTFPANTAMVNPTLQIQIPGLSARSDSKIVQQQRIPALLLGLLLLPFARRLRKTARKLGRSLSILAVLAISGALFAVCGCGSSNGFFAQKQQAYTATATVAVGSVSHSTNMTLTVE